MKNKYPSFFIIGLPRSGTKLLRSLLNNNSKIFIPEVETVFLPKFLTLYRNVIINEKKSQEIIKRIKKTLFHFYYSDLFDFDFNYQKSLDVKIDKFISDFYFELMQQRNLNATLIGDKSPSYINHLKLLNTNFPKAKYIHIYRDPREVALSAKKAWGKNLYRTAIKWNYSINNFSKFKKNNDNLVLEISYEELISNTKSVMKRCVQFLEISYEKDMHVLNKNIENLGTAQTNYVTQNNNNKYKKILSKKQIKKIESYCFDEMLAKGYKSENKNLHSKKPNVLENISFLIHDVCSLIKFNVNEHGFIKGFKKIISSF